MNNRPFIRVNHKIRLANIRCIGPDGAMLGIISTSDAMRIAQTNGMDLVEISPNADPPVCRIMDFGKYMYEESRKRRVARKHQHTQVVKEIKFHANVGDHDFDTKVGRIKEFLTEGNKVKVSLQFRGRENIHKELGFQVINRCIAAIADVGIAESTPRLIGKGVFTMLAPKAKP